MTVKTDLYDISYAGNEWYFTSGQVEVDHNGNIYRPLAGLKRSTVEDIDIHKCDIQIVMPYPYVINNEDDVNLQDLLIDKIYIGTCFVTIIELDNNEPLVLFKGRVTNPKFNDSNNTMTLVCSTSENYQNRNILTRKFQRNCPNKTYDKYCGLDVDQWSFEAIVTNINDLTITFDTNEVYETVVNYYTRGLLYINGVFIYIVSSSLNTVTLYEKRYHLKVGDVVKIAPGCDQTRGGNCSLLFHNEKRFMGFPEMLTSNPVNKYIVR